MLAGTGHTILGSASIHGSRGIHRNMGGAFGTDDSYPGSCLLFGT